VSFLGHTLGRDPMPHLTRLGIALSVLVSLGLGTDRRTEQVEAISAALRASDFVGAVDRCRSALREAPTIHSS
jgi:hypothetical protein